MPPFKDHPVLLVDHVSMLIDKVTFAVYQVIIIVNQLAIFISFQDYISIFVFIELTNHIGDIELAAVIIEKAGEIAVFGQLALV